jgi:hypothetical protein
MTTAELHESVDPDPTHDKPCCRHIPLAAHSAYFVRGSLVAVVPLTSCAAR